MALNTIKKKTQTILPLESCTEEHIKNLNILDEKE